MKLLIFAFLAITASATNYGYYSSSYPSYYGSYGGGYGSSLYGLSYGSGLGYGSGYGYGSGITYGIGGGHGHYTYAKPAVYTTSTSGGQYYDTGAYDPGTYGGTGASYTSGAAPGKISFTLGEAGYQTGSKAVYDGQQYRSGAYSPGAYDFRGDIGTYDVEEYSTGVHNTGKYGKTRTNYRSGYPSGVAPGKISFTLGGAGYETGSSVGSGYGNVRSTTISKPYDIYQRRTPSIRHSGYQGSAGAPGRISFTQDFSRVSGQSSGMQRPLGISGISTVKRTGAPVTVVKDEFPTAVDDNIGSSISSEGYGGSGVLGSDFQEIDGIGSLNDGDDYTDGGVKAVSSPAVPRSPTGSTVGRRTVHKIVSQPQDSFTQDFSEVSGEIGVSAIKPAIHSYEKVRGPVRTVVVPKVINRSGSQGIRTTGALPQIVFTQDFSKVGGLPGIVASKPQSQSFNRVISPVRPVVVSKQPSGIRQESGLRRTSPGVGPARITFIQDFSKVTGHQTSGIKPVITTRSKMPAFPAVLTSPVALKPAIQPIYEKKSQHQPITISQKPTYTTVYDQAPVQRTSGGAIQSHWTAEKSAEPVSTGFAPEHDTDYKQEVTDIGGYRSDKFSEIAYAPRAEAVSDKSSSYDQSSLTSGLGNAVSSYKFTSADRVGDIGQGRVGYSAVSAPFKSYYSSSYPGYSHVSGESPRFDFSHDKSLLYTYSSPYISSPFSYTYTSGMGQADQIYAKSIA